MGHPKILILRLSAMGDVIRTLPAVKALREHFRSSSITWIVEEPSRTLLESQPEIDEVILFPRRKWVKGMKSVRRWWSTLCEMGRFALGLRRRKFDIVLDFHGILKSGLLSFLSGSPRRIGYDRKSCKEFNFLFSNVKVKLPEEKVSRFQRNFSLLKGLEVEVRTSEPRIHIPTEDRMYVNSFFNSLQIPLRKPFLAIHPGTNAKASFKRWMPDQYASLADRLIKELGASVILTWGPEELDQVQDIQKRMKEPSILSPRTESLTQLAEVFSHCSLYIGGDTGPMHIASLMGIPVVVIYGPTDPIENEPFGEHRKVRKEVGCNPCRNRFCSDLRCLKAINVEDVFKAVNEALALTR